MIELNGVKITEEQFARLAKSQGFKKEYEYPMIMKWKHTGEIWKFISLREATCLCSGTNKNAHIGEHSLEILLHKAEGWKPCEAPEELFDGLTKSQWQQVFDEELIVECYDSENQDGYYIGNLKSIDLEENFKFQLDDDETYIHCKVHKSQPQFGKRAEWVKDDDLIAYKTVNSIEFDLPSNIDWDTITRWQVISL